MSQPLHIEQTERRALRKCRLLLYVTLPALYVLYSYVLCPLYTVCVTDIMFLEAPQIYLVYALDLLSRLVDYAALCLVFALLPYMALRFGMSRTVPSALVCVGCFLFKYMSNLFVTWLFNDFSTLNAYSLPRDLASVFLQTGLDALMLFAALFTFCLCRRRRIRDAVLSGELQDGAYPGYAVAFPYKKLISVKNPLQCAALVASGFTTLISLVGRVLYDVQYGAPDSGAEVVSMVFHYLGDFVLGMLVYTVVILIQICIDRKARKNKA